MGLLHRVVQSFIVLLRVVQNEMADLECRDCGMEASYADANIADQRKTCGVELTPSNTTEKGTARGGSKHDWTEAC